MEFSTFIGRPTVVLAVWVCFLAGWPWEGVLVLGAYIGFNLVWSLLEARRLPITRGSHPRAIANFVFMFGIFASLAHTDGAWIMALPTMFGSQGSPTMRQARYVRILALLGIALGSFTAGIPWTQVATLLVGLGLVGTVSERLYQPLLQAFMVSRERQAALDQSNAELERALEARKTFLATMSHEIRTPMNGVLGMAQLLDGTELDEEQRRMLAVLRTSGQGLLAILNDILDISKLEAGRMAVDEQPTDVATMARQVTELLRHGSLSRDVMLEVVDEGVPSSILTDPLRLRQVLVNLIGNACKFTAEGSIIVRLRWADDTLCVAVEDTGIGIPEATCERLFQPFEQADAGTTRRYGGSGLGLAISHRLIDLMGGRISVESTVGEGSIFAFSLPAPETDEISMVSELSISLDHDASRVLLVDDNRTNLMVASAMLQRLGCEIVALDGGQQALDHLQRDRDFDLVLLDCQMPEVDGFTTCERLRERGWTGPVLALTAGVTDEERTRCLESGMDDVLHKPTSIEALRRALATWTEGRRDRSRLA